jgi:hypothetical protein
MLPDQTGSLQLFATDVVLLRIDRLWEFGATQAPRSTLVYSPAVPYRNFGSRSEILHFVRIWGRSN